MTNKYLVLGQQGGRFFLLRHFQEKADAVNHASKCTRKGRPPTYTHVARIVDTFKPNTQRRKEHDREKL